MRFIVLLEVIVAALTVIAMGCASAEDTSRVNNVGPASESKSIEFGNMSRRLRGSNKPGSEERAAIDAAAMVMSKPVLKISTQATHATDSVVSPRLQAAIERFAKKPDHQPIPKWAKALFVLLTLGAVSGGVYGAIKTAQAGKDK